jgi:hypothetical protein
MFFIFVANFLFQVYGQTHTTHTMEPLSLEVAVVVESTSLWQPQDIEEAFTNTNKILSTCGISIRRLPTIVSEFKTIIPDYESTTLANRFYSALKTPIVFLVNGVRYNQSAGFSPGEKSLFLSIYSRHPDYKKSRSSDYEPLAHEFGHMLGNLPHLGEDSFNLMAGYIANQSSHLTEEQCKKMRSHRNLQAVDLGGV